MASGLDLPKLEDFFTDINSEHFEGLLSAPFLKWNSRLRTSAGRFIPARQSLWKVRPPTIEIALYLVEERKAFELIKDTIAHEMIHYWLWLRRRPYGHTSEFIRKMREMGVSRYNPVPRRRPYRYAYRCPNCFKEFLARRKLKLLACAACCKKFSHGRYDFRFKLIFERSIEG